MFSAIDFSFTIARYSSVVRAILSQLMYAATASPCWEFAASIIADISKPELCEEDSSGFGKGTIIYSSSGYLAFVSARLQSEPAKNRTFFFFGKYVALLSR